MEAVEAFESARPRLMSLAFRIVGSHHDAEDAVQTAWARTQAAGTAQVENPDAWFATVTARACLDILRGRRRRAELPLLADDVPSGRMSADEAFLRREDLSRALLVLLAELSPRQRVAYVLHDLFAVPFDEIATVLDTSTPSAKKLASRARIRLHEAGVAAEADAEAGSDAAVTSGNGPAPAGGVDRAEHLRIVDAFLAAARGGDIARLVRLMAPDAVRTADAGLLPPGVPATVHGATEVAEETRAFIDRIAVAAPMLVEGRPAAVVAPGGHPWGIVRFRIEAGLVTGIDISPYAPAGAR
ncbi:sigma-70 family RNA polymerase sigma factor [Streptomyces sp. NPDC020917]|uniref:sigma-70 family RNA polymerase sigma factor n=1 Tax=Streptomyces sp. NPDC020917 TaxID=3365102 RepID=UPI00378CC385